MPTPKSKEVMTDLETLGKTPGCVVLSIGAVSWSSAGVGREFYTVVNRDASVAIGLTEDPSTLDWWSRQSSEASKVLFEAADKKASCEPAVAAILLNRWLADELMLGRREVCIWGNGAGFDQPILEAMYRAAGVEPHWEFWNHRCFRTLKALASPEVVRSVGELKGAAHNALDDARHQAMVAAAIFKAAGR